MEVLAGIEVMKEMEDTDSMEIIEALEELGKLIVSLRCFILDREIAFIVPADIHPQCICKSCFAFKNPYYTLSLFAVWRRQIK